MLKFWLFCGDSDQYSLLLFWICYEEARFDVREVPTCTLFVFWYFGANVLGVGDAVEMLGSVDFSGRDYKDVLV